jgi:hypothetical protein
MKSYGLTPTQWYDLPRPDRLFMAATHRAERLLNAMHDFDVAEERRRNPKK